jgi:hypothetical protein
MWICMTHPECWHTSRVLARHSNHHTKYHRDGLLDCALFLIRVAKGWGTKYTGTWTNEYLVQHPEHWHRVCNKTGAGGASHNDGHATMLCTGGPGIIGNRGFITGLCHSLKWVSLSTLPPEIKALTKLSGIVFALQQLEEELESPNMGHMAIYMHRFEAVHTGHGTSRAASHQPDACGSRCNEGLRIRPSRTCDGTVDTH